MVQNQQAMNDVRRFGLTLVELLVVISIVTIVIGLMVPQMRTMTKERGIRSAATTLAAAISEAAGIARVDGYAAIELVRNRNIYRVPRRQDNSLGDPVYYACYSIRRLTAPEPFYGNDVGAVANVQSLNPGVNPTTMTVSIPQPLDSNINISPGCYLKLGQNPTRYLITAVGAPAMGQIPLTVSRDAYQSYPDAGSTHPFKIERPATANSNLNSAIIDVADNTEVTLPNGYFLNLNYSGPLTTRDNSDYTWTAFSEDLDPNWNLESIVIVFGPTGAVDQIWTNGISSGGPALVPSSAIQLCVCADSDRHTFDLTGGVQMPKNYYSEGTAAAGPDLLNEPDMLWVTLNHLTGRVNIGENASVDQIAKPENAAAIATAQVQRILQSLSIARKGKNATQ